MVAVQALAHFFQKELSTGAAKKGPALVAWFLGLVKNPEFRKLYWAAIKMAKTPAKLLSSLIKALPNEVTAKHPGVVKMLEDLIQDSTHDLFNELEHAENDGMFEELLTGRMNEVDAGASPRADNTVIVATMHGLHMCHCPDCLTLAAATETDRKWNTFLALLNKNNRESNIGLLELGPDFNMTTREMPWDTARKMKGLLFCPTCHDKMASYTGTAVVGGSGSDTSVALQELVDPDVWQRWLFLQGFVLQETEGTDEDRIWLDVVEQCRGCLYPQAIMNGAGLVRGDGTDAVPFTVNLHQAKAALLQAGGHASADMVMRQVWATALREARGVINWQKATLKQLWDLGTANFAFGLVCGGFLGLAAVFGILSFLIFLFTPGTPGLIEVPGLGYFLGGAQLVLPFLIMLLVIEGVISPVRAAVTGVGNFGLGILTGMNMAPVTGPAFRSYGKLVPFKKLVNGFLGAWAYMVAFLLLNLLEYEAPTHHHYIAMGMRVALVAHGLFSLNSVLTATSNQNEDEEIKGRALSDMLTKMWWVNLWKGKTVLIYLLLPFLMIGYTLIAPRFIQGNSHPLTVTESTRDADVHEVSLFGDIVPLADLFLNKKALNDVGFCGYDGRVHVSSNTKLPPRNGVRFSNDVIAGTIRVERLIGEILVRAKEIIRRKSTGMVTYLVLLPEPISTKFVGKYVNWWEDYWQNHPDGPHTATRLFPAHLIYGEHNFGTPKPLDIVKAERLRFGMTRDLSQYGVKLEMEIDGSVIASRPSGAFLPGEGESSRTKSKLSAMLPAVPWYGWLLAMAILAWATKLLANAALAAESRVVKVPTWTGAALCLLLLLLLLIPLLNSF